MSMKVVSADLYKDARKSEIEKTKEIEKTQEKLQALNQKYACLLLEVEQSKKLHEETLAVARNQEKDEREEEKQKIKQLESDLLKERRDKEEAAKAAKESLNKLQGKVDDLQFELQENGRMRIGKSISPRHAEDENLSSQPIIKSGPPKTPMPALATPFKVVCNKENTFRSPLTGSKTPGRNKFAMVNRSGGLRGLRQRVQNKRSPRAQPGFAM